MLFDKLQDVVLDALQLGLLELVGQLGDGRAQRVCFRRIVLGERGARLGVVAVRRRRRGLRGDLRVSTMCRQLCGA